MNEFIANLAGVKNHLLELGLFAGFSLALMKFLRVVLRGVFGSGCFEFNVEWENVSIGFRTAWGAHKEAEKRR